LSGLFLSFLKQICCQDQAASKRERHGGFIDVQHFLQAKQFRAKRHAPSNKFTIPPKNLWVFNHPATPKVVCAGM
jgi:hypothetical protein